MERSLACVCPHSCWHSPWGRCHGSTNFKSQHPVAPSLKFSPEQIIFFFFYCFSQFSNRRALHLAPVFPHWRSERRFLPEHVPKGFVSSAVSCRQAPSHHPLLSSLSLPGSASSHHSPRAPAKSRVSRAKRPSRVPRAPRRASPAPCRAGRSS